MLNQVDRTVKMLNDIALNAGTHPDPKQARMAVLSHIQRFWARPMKRTIIACLETHAEAMHPVGYAAVEQLAQEWSDVGTDVK